MSSTMSCHYRYRYNRLFFLFLISAIFGTPVWSQSGSDSTPQDPSYTCSSDKPCAIGCCGKFGICGMGPDFCAPENCTNSCDAKAECDPAGWGPQYVSSETCPLNVCCSKYGFCGSTPEFCGDKVVTNPSCVGGSSATGRNIGYYEGWAITRPCDAMAPSSIPWQDYTHINFAFASIDPVSFEVVPSDGGDPELYRELTALKSLVPGLQVWISIGGWSFTDPGSPTATTFSELAASTEKQLLFSNSLISFMTTYGFDGVDIDWEYPVAPERNGSPGDFANYPTWLANLRNTFTSAGHNFGITVTLPSSFWYLQNFDIVALEPLVDWFNMMEYDLHGTWDSTDVWIGPYVSAHTNLTEIDQSLKLLWNNNIDPAKVTLGLGFYARTYTLQDPNCVAAGCPFTAGAPAGPCTQSVGTLSYAEIERIIAAGGTTVTEDTTAAVNLLTWGDNNYWASYDTAATLKLKIDYANNNCLGGTMVWALSLDDSAGTASSALTTGRSASRGSSAETPHILALTSTNLVNGCVLTGCSLGSTPPSCPSGMTLVQSTTLGCVVPVVQGLPSGTSYNSFCCPSNNVPVCDYASQVFVSTNPICTTPACPADSVAVFQNYAPNTNCPLNPKNYCCQTPPALLPRDIGCFWTPCGSANVCPSDTAALINTSLGQNGAQTCYGGQTQTLCCPTPMQIDPKTCAWNTAGSLRGLCLPGCPSDKIAVANDVAQQSCIFGQSTYCCSPPSNDAVATTEAQDDFAVAAVAFIGGLHCSGDSTDLKAKRELERHLGWNEHADNASSSLPLLTTQQDKDDHVHEAIRRQNGLEGNEDGNFSSLYSLRKKDSNSISKITTMGMALRLAPLVYDFVNYREDETKYIQPLADEWDLARTITGNSATVPSFSSLTDIALANNANPAKLVGAIASALCPIQSATYDPITCSLATCSGGSACPIVDKRARGETPADVTIEDFPGVNAVVAGAPFTNPATFPEGAIFWWLYAKNLDWWLGSNHGVSSGSNVVAIPSSVVVEFTEDPNQNLITGAGPVWGCTAVAVVSSRGVWTGHFWQEFFNEDNGNTGGVGSQTWDDQVTQFLVNGDASENYPGLSELTRPGGIMDPALVDWIEVVVMTPQAQTQTFDPIFPMIPPVVTAQPGQLYPDEVDDMLDTIHSIFSRNTGVSIEVHTYAPDQAIWDWVLDVPTSNWQWRLNRGVHFLNDDWVGMLTVQRTATNAIGVFPQVRIWVENNIVLTLNL